MKKGKDLSWVSSVEPSDWASLAQEHKFDISASIYTRMKELGLSQKELAEATGIDKGQISRIIKGEHNLTLDTLARFEIALKFGMDTGFKYYRNAKEIFACITYDLSTTLSEDKRTRDSAARPSIASFTEAKAFSSDSEVAA